MKSLQANHTRFVSSFLGAATVVILSGCAQTTPSAETEPESTAGSDTTAVSFADGSYSARAQYQTPRSVEEIEVKLTLVDGNVSAVSVTGDPVESESKKFQSQFISGIEAEVVGKPIAGLSVDVVSGSSLTGAGFNQALEQIRTDASSAEAPATLEQPSE